MAFQKIHLMSPEERKAAQAESAKRVQAMTEAMLRQSREHAEKAAKTRASRSFRSGPHPAVRKPAAKRAGKMTLKQAKEDMVTRASQLLAAQKRVTMLERRSVAFQQGATPTGSSSPDEPGATPPFAQVAAAIERMRKSTNMYAGEKLSAKVWSTGDAKQDEVLRKHLIQRGIVTMQNGEPVIGTTIGKERTVDTESHQVVVRSADEPHGRELTDEERGELLQAQQEQRRIEAELTGSPSQSAAEREREQERWDRAEAGYRERSMQIAHESRTQRKWRQFREAAGEGGGLARPNNPYLGTSMQKLVYRAGPGLISGRVKQDFARFAPPVSRPLAFAQKSPGFFGRMVAKMSSALFGVSQAKQGMTDAPSSPRARKSGWQPTRTGSYKRKTSGGTWEYSEQPR